MWAQRAGDLPADIVLVVSNHTTNADLVTAAGHPYQAAYDRGVKLIGAAAHYVSEELDAGPIIEQDVRRVDYRHSPDDLHRLGRYIERVVLSRAVLWHGEDRVLLQANKTIVFA